MMARKMSAKALVRTLVLGLAIALVPALSEDLEDFHLFPDIPGIPMIPEVVPEVVFGTDDDTPGELWVSKESSYCDWKQNMGPICNYNATNQVVVVPAGLTLPPGQLEVEIHLAKTVHVYPTCISWIQIFSAGLVTTLPSEQEYYTVYRKRCRTWLRIYNSRADTISHGVKDLTIINSQVNTINLVQQRDFMAINSSIKSIEALNWEGYRGTIQNTTIQRVSQVVAKDNLLVIGSHFGFVASDGIVFKAKEMSVTNSSISHIASQGLKIVNGAASFSNVTIDILETSAIVVKSPSAFLVLSNVTIISAFANCIILPDRERISINNVTIKGVPLDISSPYLKFVDDFVIPENVSKVQVDEQREGCSSTATTLACDFSSVNQSIELKAANIEGYQHVQIKNVKSLKVLSTSCNLDLHLHNVNGTLPHFVTDSNHTKDSSTQSEATKIEEECNMSLNVTGSKLEVISNRYIYNMTLINSTVNRIHDGSLEGFNVLNVTVVTLDSVNTRGTGGTWKGLVVGSIFNVTLQAPVKAEGVLVTQRLRRGALTIDHPNATTELSKVKFSTLERGSIVVKRGKLILRDFIAIAINEEAIFVEEGATIELDNVVSFLTSYRTISVATREQISLNGTNLATGMMVHIRNPPPPPDSSSNLTISAVHLSSYCSAVPFFLKVCDFSEVTNASVVVDLEGGQQSQRAVVRGASFVTLYPSCIEKLILLKVDWATTVDNEKECDTWLEAKGVHFKNITAGIHDVTLNSCVVDFLSPNRKLRDFDLEDTHVKWLAGVHWSGYTGLFNNSILDKVEGLVASSRMVMSNTKVGKVLKRGITVEMDGVITNSTIDNIATKGIIVTGALRMKDVTINKLAKRAIVVRDGLLYLTNVSIASSDEFSIVATANGGVAMQNVTVAGKSVQWLGFLAESFSPEDNSLVFVNRFVYGINEKLESAPIPTLPEPSRSTPQSSSMTKSVSPEDNSSSTLGPADKISTNQIDTSSSWKWAGIGVGFLMALLLGCCVFLTVKLLKPNKGRLMPIVFWRVKDDQNELITDDQPSEFSETSRTGYQVVPGTDVL